jgi:hypothetical protein
MAALALVSYDSPTSKDQSDSHRSVDSCDVPEPIRSPGLSQKQYGPSLAELQGNQAIAACQSSSIIPSSHENTLEDSSPVPKILEKISEDTSDNPRDHSTPVGHSSSSCQLQRRPAVVYRLSTLKRFSLNQSILEDGSRGSDVLSPKSPRPTTSISTEYGNGSSGEADSTAFCGLLISNTTTDSDIGAAENILPHTKRDLCSTKAEDISLCLITARDSSSKVSDFNSQASDEAERPSLFRNTNTLVENGSLEKDVKELRNDSNGYPTVVDVVQDRNIQQLRLASEDVPVGAISKKLEVGGKMRSKSKRRSTNGRSNSVGKTKAKSKRYTNSNLAQGQIRSRFRSPSPSSTMGYVIGKTESLAGHFRRIEVIEVVDSSNIKVPVIEYASLPNKRRRHSITTTPKPSSKAALRPILGLAVGNQFCRSKSHNPPRPKGSTLALPTIPETSSSPIITFTLPGSISQRASTSPSNETLDWTAYQLAISGPTGDYLQQGTSSPTLSDLSIEDGIAEWFQSYDFSSKEGRWTTQWDLLHDDNVTEPIELDAGGVAAATILPNGSGAGEWDWEWGNDSSNSGSESRNDDDKSNGEVAENRSTRSAITGGNDDYNYQTAYCNTEGTPNTALATATDTTALSIDMQCNLNNDLSGFLSSHGGGTGP